MITCKVCGQQNADGTIRCSGCGVAIGHQMRADRDAKRGMISTGFRAVMWVVALILIVCIAPPIYKASGSAYFKWRLKSLEETADKACNGPITDTMPESQRAQIQQCLNEDSPLQKAKSDYNSFTKPAK